MAMEGGEAGDEMTRCEDCRVYYTAQIHECPICGKEGEQE
jgi:rRNA maturation protein Nop10